jgi:hypothetical protein
VCVFQGDPFAVPGGAIRIDQRDHAQNLAVRLSQDDQPALVPYRSPGRQSAVFDQQVTLVLDGARPAELVEVFMAKPGACLHKLTE